MKGQIKIRKAVESQPPLVVYVEAYHQYMGWICKVLNKSETCFSGTKQLVDFDFLEYNRMHHEWAIEYYEGLKNHHNQKLEFYKIIPKAPEES